jgi:hypothetical protein
MRSLKQLYIAGNGLMGNLQMFEMPNLSALILNANRFTGTLSSNISYHGFEIFDISSNRITGYLNANLEPEGGHDKIKFHTARNRLSGPVNAKAIDMYASVQVLLGNSISCNTLPIVDIDYKDSVFFSTCETRQIYFAIIIWCVSLGFVLVIGAINSNVCLKDAFSWIRQNKSYFETKSIRLFFPGAMQLVVALQKLLKLVFITSLCAITFLVALYYGFEYDKNANILYNVQFKKYNYAFSGIYLKSVSPAVALFVAFTLLSTIIVLIIYRIFLFDSALMLDTLMFLKSEAASTSIDNDYAFSRYFLLVIFISISFFMNAAYVYGYSQPRKYNALGLQIGFFICDSIYKNYGITWFLTYLNKKAFLVKGESASFRAKIMTFTQIVNPCLATLVIDSNCFRNDIFGEDVIGASYSYPSCEAYNTATLSCFTTGEVEVSSSFTPPFIYGHHCRDAVFGNYIPVLILSCVFNTFIYSLLVLYTTNRIQSLNSQIVLFSFVLESRKLLFWDNIIVESVERIIFDLVLIILFGIAYPLCFVFLVIDITSRIFLLIRRVQLYIELYQRTVNDKPELDKENREYLEKDVYDTVLITPYLVWPGLGAASIIFGLYLFDMAWDTTGNELSAPIVLLVLNIICFVAICTVFFKAKAKIDADLAIRIESLSSDNSFTNISQPQASTNPLVDIELFESQIIENPILATIRR